MPIFISIMKFIRLSPYLLTDNQENTFTLKPINCNNGECAIELKVNGKKMTNTEMPDVEQIKISHELLQAVSMRGMIHKLRRIVATVKITVGFGRTINNEFSAFPSLFMNKKS